MTSHALGADGTLEVVGRRSSFLKVNGVRLDVEHVEQLLAADGLSGLVGGDDERLLALVVGDVRGVDGAALVDRSTRALTGATGLPAHRVAVAPVPALPRHPNGKLDRGAIAPTMDLLAVTATERLHGAGVAALVVLYAELLARPDSATRPSSTWVATRCRTSSCRCTSRSGSDRCPPTGRCGRSARSP